MWPIIEHILWWYMRCKLIMSYRNIVLRIKKMASICVSIMFIITWKWKIMQCYYYYWMFIQAIKRRHELTCSFLDFVSSYCQMLFKTNLQFDIISVRHACKHVENIVNIKCVNLTAISANLLVYQQINAKSLSWLIIHFSQLSINN